MNDTKEQVLQTLKELDIPFELYEHEAFFTCEDADNFAKAHPDGGHLKNLLLRNKKGDQHYLYFHPNVNTASLRISREGLQKFLDSLKQRD